MAGAHLQVYEKNTDGTEDKLIDEWDSGEAEHVVANLKAGATYVIRETKAPEGYLAAEEIRFTVAEDGSIVCDGKMETDADGSQVLLVEDPKKPMEVSVTKIWEDEDNRDGIRPASVRIQLLADGRPADEKIEGLEDAVAELSDENKWTWTWAGLPKMLDGREVEYAVEETENVSVSVRHPFMDVFAHTAFSSIFTCH